MKKFNEKCYNWLEKNATKIMIFTAIFALWAILIA
ncbi:hypothetical protein O1Q81_01403 [Lonepinella sp. MS14436]